MAASLPVAWQLDGKAVLIVGGGPVACSRLDSVLPTGARVSLVAPSVSPPLARLLAEHPVVHHAREFQPSDLDTADMVLTAIDNVELSRSIAAQCREKRIPVNAADIPPSCDFYFGSLIRRGPLQILVSTNGKGPKIANLIRTRLESALPENIEDTINNVGLLRSKLRERAPGVGGAVGARRMKWMIDVCTTWELEQLAGMDEQAMERLLDEGWESMSVPPPPVRAVPDAPRTASPFYSGVLCGVALACVGLYCTRRILHSLG